MSTEERTIVLRISRRDARKLLVAMRLGQLTKLGITEVIHPAQVAYELEEQRRKIRAIQEAHKLLTPEELKALMDQPTMPPLHKLPPPKSPFRKPNAPKPRRGKPPAPKRSDDSAQQKDA